MTAVLRWATIATERDVNQPRLDITDSRDVARLVNVFYDRVRDDDLLGPIFDDIAHVDWATHLPRMYDFWESVLFARATFKGTPLLVHRVLARRTPLTPAAFDRWITLFQSTVDDLFSGPMAEHAKNSAARIAVTMERNIDSSTSSIDRSSLTDRNELVSAVSDNRSDAIEAAQGGIR
jgi:hemoglobin